MLVAHAIAVFGLLQPVHGTGFKRRLVRPPENEREEKKKLDPKTEAHT